MIPELTIGDGFLPLFDGGVEDRFVLIEGRRGTGKTRAILTWLLCQALAYPGSRWIIARSTRTRLSDSVLTTLDEQVFPAFGMSIPGGAEPENRSHYRLPNGSTFVLLGLDDPQRTQSVECCGIYVSEGVEIQTIERVTALAGAMRQAIPGVQHRCIVDCNPGHPGHWLNEVAEPFPNARRHVGTKADYERLLAHARTPAPPGKWKRLVTCVQDNPAYFDVVKWGWKEPGAAYLKTLDHLTGHLRRRWLDGYWCAAEGSVYPNFDEETHVVDPFDASTWPHFVGWDPGFDHPTAILWFAVSPTNTIYVVDEIYRGGRGVPEHCEDVRKHNAGRTVHAYYGDPQHAFSKTAQSPKPISEQAAECGIRMTPWPRTAGSEESMVEAVRKLISAGKLKVFRTCRNTINEFQSWSYKRTAAGEIPDGEDKFEDKNNHAMDVVKGVIAAGISYGARGVEVTPPDAGGVDLGTPGEGGDEGGGYEGLA